MSIDLQDPIAAGRTVAHAVSRHAADVARSVDLPDPVEAVTHARRRANRAARRLERRVDHASKRAAARVRTEAEHVGGRPHRWRRVVVVVGVVALGAAAAAVVASRRARRLDADVAPDPFGTAVRAAEHPPRVPEAVATG